MSTNFGSDNETRWYVLPDYTLPSGDWTWLAVAAPFDSNDWYLFFARNTSGVTTSGNVRINTTIVDPQPPVVQSPLAGATALWKGYLSWAALLDASLTDQDLINLASGSELLIPEYSVNIVDLWDFAEPLPSIPGQVTGDLALRYGEDYPAAGPDPLPYDVVTVHLVYQVPDLTTIEWRNFSYDVAQHFQGTQRPFSFSLASGVLPPGITLSPDGLLSVPEGTSPVDVAGIVVRATDTDTSTADTNSFSLRVLPLPEVGVTELQHKRAGIPQNMTVRFGGYVEGWLPVTFLTRERGVSNNNVLFIEYSGDIKMYDDHGDELPQIGSGPTRRAEIPGNLERVRMKIDTGGSAVIFRTNGS